MAQVSKVSPARAKALEALLVIHERDAFAREVIDKVIDTSKLSEADRAFATRLVLGVVQMRGVLDLVLDKVMRSPDDVKSDVRIALRISVYEIIYLQKSPHAAVDQGVELVRSIAPKAAGLANAVLRKVVRAKASFPFGNPKSNIEAYSNLHGFPVWLTRRVLKDIGAERLHDFLVASNEPAPLFIAVNSIKATDEEIVGLFEGVGSKPVPGVVNGKLIPGCYYVDDPRSLNDGRVKRALNQGKILVSDAASQAVAEVVASFKADSLLEIGAGRGTKTILLQSNAFRKYGRQVNRFVTVDNLEFKTKLIQERAELYGCDVSRSITADARDLSEELNDELFDVVFIDAPCTGLGTLRRHPEIRWRIKPESIVQHAELNAQLLKSASSSVRRGGILVYATCTITSEENEDVIKGFCSSECGNDLEHIGTFRTYLAPHGCDAHFCSVLKRI